MPEVSDIELLQDYTRHASEEAFAVLVQRHVNLVYSTALRHVGIPAQAEEITQAVFIILARKAAGLRPDTVLEAWLYETTRLTSLSFLRGERRRQFREQEAYMQSTIQESNEASNWSQLAPLLDEAMARLGKKGPRSRRAAFFQGKKPARSRAGHERHRSRGPKPRASRAGKIARLFFQTRRAFHHCHHCRRRFPPIPFKPRPVALAKTVTAVAIAKGAAAPASTLTLIKGALKIMAWTKAKTAVIAGVAVILLAAGTVAISSRSFWFADDEIRFEAEGVVTYATSHEWPGGKSTYLDRKHFIVEREGNHWKIRTVTIKEERTGPRGPVPASVDMYGEMGFDGTNIYTLEQQDKSKILRMMPKVGVFAEGRVEKADAPPCMDSWLFYPVWLAYCSTPYFQSLNGTNAVSPLFALRNGFLNEPSKTMRLPAQWDTQDKNFMKDISWFSDGTVEATGADGKTRVEQQRSPYDYAFLQGRFDNVSWTNWNGVSPPASFQLTVYSPSYRDAPGAKPTFLTVYTVTGTLEQVRTSDKFSPVPELITTTAITDLRKKHWTGINGHSGYLSSNGWSPADAIIH